MTHLAALIAELRAPQPDDECTLYTMGRRAGRHEVADRLDALLAGGGWLPIAEAPKDGTEVDVFCSSSAEGDSGGYRIANAWFCRADNRWRYYGDDRISWAHPPTHWQPLPLPPGDPA